MEWLEGLHPIIQALVATGFTWALTALGAGGVFLSRQPSRKLLYGMLGICCDDNPRYSVGLVMLVDSMPNAEP